MDTNTQLPIMTTHTPLFDEVHLKPLEVSLPVSRPLSISGTCSEEIGSNLKTGLDNFALADSQVPKSSKKRKVILRVDPANKGGSSKRVRQGNKNLKPAPKPGARPKKRSRPRKAPKIEETDQENGSSDSLQPQLGADPTGATMGFPPGLFAGFCAPPYFAYLNPPMSFGGGMTMDPAPNLPQQSFGNIMYNPFTGAPLFGNTPTQFPDFPYQTSQSMPFNGIEEAGFLGQMLSQSHIASVSNPVLNAPGNVIVSPMDQTSFFGDPQNCPTGMPVGLGMTSQTLPESMMSMSDLLNQPLDAGWTHSNFST
ncbi:unnamed protein product [Rhizoctonia solani]|uniref:Uncharacterized protein n=1 Tax=Rhizoctonia solani TaxID=456999 RepID=A0A8H3B4H1_9AGAM|nr:unnamed protein product [Rhizoctonia solani]